LSPCRQPGGYHLLLPHCAANHGHPCTSQQASLPSPTWMRPDCHCCRRPSSAADLPVGHLLATITCPPSLQISPPQPAPSPSATTSPPAKHTRQAVKRWCEAKLQWNREEEADLHLCPISCTLSAPSSPLPPSSPPGTAELPPVSLASMTVATSPPSLSLLTPALSPSPVPPLLPLQWIYFLKTGGKFCVENVTKKDSHDIDY
jgi:hypothetical protein